MAAHMEMDGSEISLANREGEDAHNGGGVLMDH